MGVDIGVLYLKNPSALRTPPARSSLPPLLGKGQEVSPDKDVRAFRLASESVLPFFIALP